MTSNLGWQTFADIVAEVGVLVHDTNVARQPVIKAIINRAYDSIASEFDWPQFVEVDETGTRRISTSATAATFEAGQAEAPLPYSLAAISSFELQYQDTSAPRIPIVDPATLYEAAGSALTTAGRPRMAALIGQTAQTDRLPASDTLVVKATQPTNDNMLTLRVRYLATSGSYKESFSESLTGSFSTGVSLYAPSIAGWSVQQVVIPATWEGNVRVEDTSGNAVVFISSPYRPPSAGSPVDRAVSSPLLRLWPVPDIDYAVTVTYRRRPHRLVNDDDAPEIPVASYLVEKAAAEILRQQNKPDLGAQHEIEGMRFLRALHRRHLPRPQRARAKAFVDPLYG